MPDGHLWSGRSEGDCQRVLCHAFNRIGMHARILLRIAPDKAIAEEDRTYTAEDGLPHNWVWDVLQDLKGDLWLGSWNGLGHYSL